MLSGDQVYTTTEPEYVYDGRPLCGVEVYDRVW